MRAPEVRVEAPRVRADANLNAGLDFKVRAPEVRVEAPKVNVNAGFNGSAGAGAGLKINLSAP